MFLYLKLYQSLSTSVFRCFQTLGLIVSSLDLAETRVLVMEDMLVFLQEKDQKYSLLSLDQKVRSLFVPYAVFFRDLNRNGCQGG